jgi:hypothetical protein
MIARWMIIGFVIWLVIALAFRMVGETVFTAGPGGVSWLFLTMPLVLFGLTYALLKGLKVASGDRCEAAAIFAVPGLLIGIYMINSFRFVFPNLDPSLSLSFASLMFASYAAVIIAGIVSSRLQRI